MFAEDVWTCTFKSLIALTVWSIADSFFGFKFSTACWRFATATAWMTAALFAGWDNGDGGVAGFGFGFSDFWRSWSPLSAASAFLMSSCFFNSFACSSKSLIWLSWSIYYWSDEISFSFGFKRPSKVWVALFNNSSLLTFWSTTVTESENYYFSTFFFSRATEMVLRSWTNLILASLAMDSSRFSLASEITF